MEPERGVPLAKGTRLRVNGGHSQEETATAGTFPACGIFTDPLPPSQPDQGSWT